MRRDLGLASRLCHMSMCFTPVTLSPYDDEQITLSGPLAHSLLWGFWMSQTRISHDGSLFCSPSSSSVLRYEPENPEVVQFLPLIQQRLLEGEKMTWCVFSQLWAPRFGSGFMLYFCCVDSSYMH